MKNRLMEIFNVYKSYFGVAQQQGRVQLDTDGSQTGALAGLYRAIVISALDPENRMRVKVKVLSNDAVMFAEPCIPSLNTQVTLPAAGAGVWIMFEKGDPNFPVWMGNIHS